METVLLRFKSSGTLVKSPAFRWSVASSKRLYIVTSLHGVTSRKTLIFNRCAVRQSNLARDGLFAVKCTQTAGINRLTSGWVIRSVGKLVFAPTARVPSSCPCSAEILICVLVRSYKEVEWFEAT
jgi:hypothetical protein